MRKIDWGAPIEKALHLHIIWKQIHLSCGSCIRKWKRNKEKERTIIKRNTLPLTCTIMNILISITTGNSHRSWLWMRCFGTLFTYVYPLPCYTSVCSDTGGKQIRLSNRAGISSIFLKSTIIAKTVIVIHVASLVN